MIIRDVYLFKFTDALQARLDHLAERKKSDILSAEEEAELFIPPLELCTDNAAMAAVVVEKWRGGLWAPPDLDAVPVYTPCN